ncbi:ubiquitinyl hydrolase 1 [Malassezia equina]|uniref:Ubiquitin carboxyl-terminal hydrolase n=1 Tax=Malassezia equina TaxID=1381935 RepID=A0AAF0EJ85_9BASI|nr:ubiquitinyl hydrolase 1 [Malassezia equina]
MASGQGLSSAANSSAPSDSTPSKLDLSNVKSFSKSRGPMKISPLNMQLQSSRMSGPRTPLTATLDSPIGVPGNVTMPPSYSAYGWTPTEWSRWGTDKGRSIHLSKKKSVLLGMENFGNTCYANSVLQALYHCRPFRGAMMEPEEELMSRLTPASTSTTQTMQYALTNLFHSMALTASRLAANPRSGHIKKFHMPSEGRTAAIIGDSVDRKALESFLGSLRNSSNLFDSTMHHDAHEFLNFLLNQVDEDLEKKQAKRLKEQPLASPTVEASKTFVNRLFQGVLTNETRCLSCETITSRDEEFLDLSINVSPYTSVSSCLRIFSDSEMLAGRNKFFCDTCSSLQEAEKRMKIKSSPNILALHLKRFRYDENINAYIKHACRVVFPLDLRLFNSSDESSNPDRLYELVAIVIHVGSGVHQGHYVSIVKIGSRWALFDDEEVQFIPESDISKYYGDAPETGSAYVLFYQTVSKDRTERDRQEMTMPGTPGSDVLMSPVSANFRPSSAPMARRSSASYNVFASSPLSPSPRHSALHPPASKPVATGPSSLNSPLSPLASHEPTTNALDETPEAEPESSSLSKNQDQTPFTMPSNAIKEAINIPAVTVIDSPNVSTMPVKEAAPAPAVTMQQPPVTEALAPVPAVTTQQSSVTDVPAPMVKLYDMPVNLGQPATMAESKPAENSVSQGPQASQEGTAAVPVMIPVGVSSTTSQKPEVTPPLSSNSDVIPAGATSSAPVPEAPATTTAAPLADAQPTTQKPTANAPPSTANNLEIVTVGSQQAKVTDEPAKGHVDAQVPPSLYQSGSTVNLSSVSMPWLQGSTTPASTMQPTQAPAGIRKSPSSAFMTTSPSQTAQNLPPTATSGPQTKPTLSLAMPNSQGPDAEVPGNASARRRPLSMFGAFPIRLPGQSGSSTSPSGNVTTEPSNVPQRRIYET